jgi:transposase InsO family protein
MPKKRYNAEEIIHKLREAGARDAIDVFADLMETHGIPEHIRSDNGPEMVAKQLRQWLARLGTKAVYITPGSPWENGYCESLQRLCLSTSLRRRPRPVSGNHPLEDLC